jgi:membrane-associated phospholipid phosphatase
MPACVPPDSAACVAPANPTPVDSLGSDLGAAFGGTNLIWYAGAVAGTAALVVTGADQTIRDGVEQHLGSSAYGNAANLTGYVLPGVVAAGGWVTGLAAGDRELTGAGSATVQALAVTLGATFVLKIGVGRAYAPESARDFAPFQSWAWPFPAWPSGHAASATSVVAALTGYYGADELWIPLVGYPVAAGIAFGMLVGDEHWTSDLIAGAVLGQCVGWSIGRAFRARARGESTASSFTIVPVLAPGTQGAALVVGW